LAGNRTDPSDLPDTARRIALVRDLVAIESVSGNEAAAVAFLTAQMESLGYESHTDSAGNAIGIRGTPSMDDSPPSTIVLLGHIDTVPGAIPVRIESGILHGRGSVDAKGPLAALVMGGALAELPRGVRLVVVGAVEEETATSRGARQIAADFKADYCVIGEPSSATAITLGYKGRALIDCDYVVDESHSAGPGKNAPELAAAFWQQVVEYSVSFNEGRPALFDQLLPSLRSINSSSDGIASRAAMRIGVRLPPGFDFAGYCGMITGWAGLATLKIHGHEPAWQSGRSNLLVRSLARAIASTGTRASYKLKTGTADLNVVGPVWKCPIVAYGPGDSSLDHTPCEHLQLSEYLQSIAILQDALTSLARAVSGGD
jgi:LysW-gamma-L-lysine carboxypeptidase